MKLPGFPKRPHEHRRENRRENREPSRSTSRMSNAVHMPLSCEVRGKTWHLYSFEWGGADGTFCGHFYAISDDHAALVLQDIKDTAKLNGRLYGIEQA